eukprot:scaffold252354_cov27-Prasinocladus_malaysianus.AAC.1
MAVMLGRYGIASSLDRLCAIHHRHYTTTTYVAKLTAGSSSLAPPLISSSGWGRGLIGGRAIIAYRHPNNNYPTRAVRSAVPQCPDPASQPDGCNASRPSYPQHEQRGGLPSWSSAPRRPLLSSNATMTRTVCLGAS